MAILRSLLFSLYATGVFASPRNLKRNAGSGGGQGPPGYGDGSWGSKSDGWDGPSGYGDGSWGHSTAPRAPSSYGGGGGGGGGGDGWGHSATCEASTVFKTSISTVLEPASTVYISGSDYTSIVPASTVYISGSGYTSIVPASTVTIGGEDHTSVTTAYETVTQPAASITVYLTRQGPGWNHTITREETDLLTTTEREYSTIVDEETVVVTSPVTLPGRRSVS